MTAGFQLARRSHAQATTAISSMLSWAEAFTCGAAPFVNTRPKHTLCAGVNYCTVEQSCTQHHYAR
eukprot:3472315-Pleurochrysis_carterae.AAC.6